MSDPPSRLRAFLGEVKRRRVYHVAVVYVVVGLGVLGAAEVILDPLGLGALRAYIVILVLLGFPIALVLAWAYEVRPEEQREAKPTTAIVEAAESERKKSIVVLPFDNLSPDPGDAYFSDGLTEEVITNLSHLQSLRVISRNSAMVLKGSKKDTRTIAVELGVQYVLEGSVRKAGDDLRITAQLIDAGSDEHLWAEKYDGRLEDVFGMQEKVSRSIVDALALRLSPAEERRLADRPIKNLTAFECFLRARADMWLMSGEGLDRALDWVERGLSIVGDDAELLAMKGFILFQYVNTLAAPPETYSSVMGQAQECADRASSLNPDSGWVQCVQGAIRNQSGDPAGMIRHTDRAVALEPSHADALMLLGYQLAAVGRHLDHSHRLLTRAAELDPLTPMNKGALGFLRAFEGKFSEAANCFGEWQQALEKGRSPFRFFLAWIHAASGNLEEGVRLVDRMVSDSPDHILTKGMRFLRHAWLGQRAAAVEALTDEWEQAARWDDLYPLLMADGYALIGEPELALQWLDYTIDYGIRNPAFLANHEPFLEPLRSTQRFRELMEKASRLSESLPVPADSIELIGGGR